MSRRLTYPCKDCQNRHPGCHSECEDYISVRTEHNRRISENNRRREVDDAIRDMEFHRYKKCKSGHK